MKQAFRSVLFGSVIAGGMMLAYAGSAAELQNTADEERLLHSDGAVAIVNGNRRPEDKKANSFVVVCPANEAYKELAAPYFHKENPAKPLAITYNGSYNSFMHIFDDTFNTAAGSSRLNPSSDASLVMVENGKPFQTATTLHETAQIIWTSVKERRFMAPANTRDEKFISNVASYALSYCQ